MSTRPGTLEGIHSRCYCCCCWYCCWCCCCCYCFAFSFLCICRCPHRLRHSTQICRNEHASWDIHRNLHLQGKEGGNLGEGGPLQTILKTNKKLLITSFFGRLEAGGTSDSRNEHASWDIQRKLHLQQKLARELRQSTQISRNEHAS